MLSLKRITGRSGLGLGDDMHRLDSGLSGEWMAPPTTVAVSVTVLVPNGYYSFADKRLFWPGFQGKPPAFDTGRKARLKWIDAFFQSVTAVH